MAEVKYFLNEMKNQILVSGSSTKAGMNALITSSKNPNTVFDQTLTAKISSLGINSSYIVQNGTDTTSIPIADNQELWVYRGFNQDGGTDGSTYRYNPHLHRPYKAYILTETGSGQPGSPYTPTGSAINNLIDPIATNIPSKYIERQLAVIGNLNSDISSSAASGSFIVHDDARGVHPFVFTKYTTLVNPPGFGAPFRIYQENVTSSFTSQEFNTSTANAYPGGGKIGFNSATPASITKVTVDSQLQTAVILGPLSESIATYSKEGGVFRVFAGNDANNFIDFDVDAVTTFTSPNQYFELSVSNPSPAGGFSLFTNNQEISSSLSGYSRFFGDPNQEQNFTPNIQPETFDTINLVNGNYTFTSSVFTQLDNNGQPCSGSTQFGLYTDFDFYVQYTAENTSNDTIRIFFTGSQGVLDSQFFDLPPNQQSAFRGLVGSTSASSATFSSTRLDNGSYLGINFNMSITNPSVPGVTPQDVFSTRWNDVYLSFSESISSSIDGLYIFNQLPQNDVQVTASVLLTAWTGSDTGSKYGAAIYETDVYGEGEEGEGPTWQTASIRIYTGSFPNAVPTTLDSFLTESIYESAFIHTQSTGVPVTFSFSIPSESISIKDCLSMAVAVSSGSFNSASVENSLVVREYSLEYTTLTQSFEGDGRVPAFIENAFSGTLGFSNQPDCQPLFNNITGERENPNIQIIEYTPTASGFGGYYPLNFYPILSGSAQKSTVPESYYTLASQINPRYLGSRTQANTVNSVEGLANGFGTLPVIDYQRAYFAYCDQVLDPYPVVNNKTQYNIKYLINDSGDALQPNLSPYTAFDVEGTWDEDGIGRVGINQISGSSQYDSLNGLQTFDKVAKEPVAILWSQTASDGYSGIIPLGGNPDVISNFEAEFTNFSLTFNGNAKSSSNADQKIVPLANMLGPGMDDASAASFSYVFNFGTRYGDAGAGGNAYTASVGTGDFLSSGSSGTPGAFLPTGPLLKLAQGPTAGTASAGEFILPVDPISPNASLNAMSDVYTISVEGRFPATPPAEYRTSAGSFTEKSQYNRGVIGELSIEFQESTNQGATWTPKKMNALAQPFLDFHYGNQTISINLATTLGANNAGFTNARKKYRILPHYNDIKNEIQQLGRNPWDALYVEYRISLESDITLKSDRRYRWASYQFFANETVDPKRNYWNPTNRPVKYGGDLTPSPAQDGPYFNVSLFGQRSQQVTTDNALNEPFWAFGTASNGTDIAPNILELISDNGNAAYDNGYFMGYLPYTASANPRFPGGIEPLDTDIPSYNIPWSLQINDEIRFENNEAQTYKIIDILTPSQAINREGSLTITLDRDVDLSVQKDFFLIRRYQFSPNTLISDNLFPYGGLKTVKKEVTNQLTTGLTKFFAENGTDNVSQSAAFSSSLDQTTSGSVKFISVVEPLTKKDNTPTGIVFPEYPTALIELDPDKVITDLRDKKLIT